MNRPPVAVVEDATAMVGDEIVLSGLASFDPDGDQLQFHFNLRAAPPLSEAFLSNAETAIASYVADRAGYFVVDLVVSDGVLDSATATAVITVLATEDAPIAYAGPDRTVRAGTEVIVTGLYSSDPTGLPLVYSWSWVSRPAGSDAVIEDPTAQAVAFGADLVGEYQLQLLVHNGSLISAPYLVTITAVSPEPPIPGDVIHGVLNPSEVYMIGTLHESSCSATAIAHWSDPNTAVVGFDCYFDRWSAQVRPDGIVLHRNGYLGPLREFHCDGCPDWVPGNVYPANVVDNDTALAVPPCYAGEVYGFLVGVTGARLHHCAGGWYDENGVAVPLPSYPYPWSYGMDNRVLTNEAVVNILTGDVAPIVGLPAGTTLTTRVADAESFWMVRASGDECTLWRIDYSGTATLVTTYADPPVGYSASGDGRLDATGTLFQVGSGPTWLNDVIIARHISGLSEVVYSEATNPAVKLHGSTLVTGP